MSSLLESFLMRQAVHFTVLTRKQITSQRNLLKAIPLTDTLGTLLAVFPHSHTLDIAALNKLLKRQLKPSPPATITALFADHKAEAIPPLGVLYDMPTMVDKSADWLPALVFCCGDKEHYIQISKRDFDRILLEESRGLSFTTTDKTNAENDLNVLPTLVTRDDWRGQELPVMPETAIRVLNAANDPDISIGSLCQIIESDPVLTAQILRYANSPYFGFSGTVDSLDKAVGMILGLNTVKNIALGVLVLGGLKPPRSNIKPIYQHAVHTAALSQEIARTLSNEQQVDQNSAYIAGLLHNMGKLVLATMYPDAWKQTLKLQKIYTDIPFYSIERKIMSMDHMEAGWRLLQNWNLPASVLISAREHHNPGYQGEHDIYAHIVLLANRFLARHGLGDELTDEFPASMLLRYRLDNDVLMSNCECIMNETDYLNDMARQLAA
ncbi:MAG: aminoacyl-tRNA deacylase and HDOD domain-containing protein [Gammaproteobacteria bacterium]|nr:MAG: aminoacyl-tRNA deacylase and HDOD domain-containing protein [Gammaproteobacteria bacterium]